MKKFISALLLLAPAFFMCACTDSSAKIDKLISEHKYDEAREVAIENFKDNSMYGDRTQQLNKIALAELEEYFLDGEYREIARINKETKNPFVFQKLFSENIKDVLKKGNYDFLLASFEDWEIYSEFHKEIDQWPHNEDYEMREPKVYDDEFMKRIADKRQTTTENGPYNAEARHLNGLIDKTLEQLIEDKDVDNIKQALKCYKPYAVMKSKNKLPSNNYSKDHGTYEHHYVFELVNSAKEEAAKKVAAAGIEL